MATYLTQTFDKNKPTDKSGIRASVVEAGEKRIRPCLMTTATTILALLPVLTSTGRGSDIMIPMAIPSFGGMLIALVTLFVVPVLFSWTKEFQLKRTIR
jgi:Cu(I)/Ag(I) efflux system membrane protein CusA/SilA